MDTFSALADPTRRQIIELLAANGALSASDIQRHFRVSAPAISQHLKVLREAKLVEMEKRAQQRIYRMNPAVMATFVMWVQRTTERWNARFNVLDELLEVEMQKVRSKSHVTAVPGAQEIFVTREFDAPRELVFKAYTDPALYAQWIGPRGHTTKLETWEPRSGGAWRYVSTDAQGNAYGFHGTNHEVTAPERIIGTFEFEGLPERGHVSLDTALFEALPDGRTRVTTHTVCRSVADRDGMFQSGMEGGINESYSRLDELLEKLK
jgi:uncharacterized protein YndB with AHSA1/START domain/DNA-binding transcriptional ArsR family regulator